MLSFRREGERRANGSLSVMEKKRDGGTFRCADSVLFDGTYAK